MFLISHFTKSCSKCKELKTFDSFCFHSYGKFKKRNECKDCQREYRENNKEIIKEKRDNNKEKKAEYCKIYYNKNKEKIRKYKAKYYTLNNNDIVEKRNKYYKDNKVHICKKAKEYRTKNTERIKTYLKKYFTTKQGIASKNNTTNKRRTKEKVGDVTTKQLLELQNNAKVCYWCNVSLKSTKVQIDHYFPLSKDGQHTISNLVVSCQKCNQSKHCKDPIEFANSIGKLL